MKTEYFKVKIVKHTPLLFGNTYENMWHVNSIGKTIKVKKTLHDGAYFECMDGSSILRYDCELLAN